MARRRHRADGTHGNCEPTPARGSQPLKGFEMGREVELFEKGTCRVRSSLLQLCWTVFEVSQSCVICSSRQLTAEAHWLFEKADAQIKEHEEEHEEERQHSRQPVQTT